MKQAAKYFVAAVVFLMGAGNIHAQTFFLIDFSPANGYVDGELEGQPAGSDLYFWIKPNPASNLASMYIENEALTVMGDGGGGKWIYTEIPLQQDVFGVTFDGVYFGDGTQTNIGVSFSDTVNFGINGDELPTYNEQGAMIRFAGNGIDMRNGDGAGGGSFTKLVETPYVDGVKFYLRAEIDPSIDKFSVWVRKEGQTEETMIAENYGFRRATSAETNGVNCMTIFDNNSDGSIAGVGIIFDNFVFYGPDGPTGGTAVSEWALY